MDLQGRVKFPTGGIVRERNALNRCNSDTDSKVWMEEDVRFAFSCPEWIHSGHFCEVKHMKKIDTKKMVLLGMFAAIAYMLVAMIRIPVLPAAPFLKYEPKDVVITIGGFLLGPMASFVICLVVALVEMVSISETGIIGCLMNMLSSVAFACTAAVVYKKRRSIGGAICGLLLGSVVMVTTMLLWNWLITPLYMGYPREAVVAMLVPVFLPFNALKAGLNCAFTMVLYKPLVSALRQTGLIPKAASKSGAKWGIYILGIVLLATCILLLLVLRGIL